ncbi:hypothetical protein DMENIID0001_159070 [Sergentomyia squamirostris]
MDCYSSDYGKYQPEFVGPHPDTTLVFRVDKAIIQVHRDKLPPTKHFVGTVICLNDDVRVTTFIELLRYMYKKKINANWITYSEILRVARFYNVGFLECELLFNINFYMTYDEILLNEDRTLLAIYEKKLELSREETIRLRKVRERRLRDAQSGLRWEYFIVYGTINDRKSKKMLRSTRNESHGPSAQLYVVENNYNLVLSLECKPQVRSLVPYGLLMNAKLDNFVLDPKKIYKFIVVVHGSIFVDKKPNHAMVMMIAKKNNNVKSHKYSLPLIQLNKTKVLTQHDVFKPFPEKLMAANSPALAITNSLDGKKSPTLFLISEIHCCTKIPKILHNKVYTKFFRIQ